MNIDKILNKLKYWLLVRTSALDSGFVLDLDIRIRGLINTGGLWLRKK